MAKGTGGIKIIPLHSILQSPVTFLQDDNTGAIAVISFIKRQLPLNLPPWYQAGLSLQSYGWRSKCSVKSFRFSA